MDPRGAPRMPAPFRQGPLFVLLYSFQGKLAVGAPDLVNTWSDTDFPEGSDNVYLCT